MGKSTFRGSKPPTIGNFLLSSVLILAGILFLFIGEGGKFNIIALLFLGSFGIAAFFAELEEKPQPNPLLKPAQGYKKLLEVFDQFAQLLKKNPNNPNYREAFIKIGRERVHLEAQIIDLINKAKRHPQASLLREQMEEALGSLLGFEHNPYTELSLNTDLQTFGASQPIQQVINTTLPVAAQHSKECAWCGKGHSKEGDFCSPKCKHDSSQAGM